MFNTYLNARKGKTHPSHYFTDDLEMNTFQ